MKIIIEKRGFEILRVYLLNADSEETELVDGKDYEIEDTYDDEPDTEEDWQEFSWDDDDEEGDE